MSCVRRRARFALTALLVLTVVALPGLGSPASAQTCEVGPLWVSGVTQATPVLRQYDVSGAVIRSYITPRSYFDIAIAANQLQLHAVAQEPTGPRLYRVAMSTGAELDAVPVTGLPAAVTINALTLLPDGRLLAGVGESGALYAIDPATGGAVAFPAVLPAPSSGDLVSLPDGDVLAAVSAGAVDRLVRIHPDNTTTVIGTVPRTFGLGVSGGQVYLGGPDGQVRKLPTIPTASSTATLPLVDVFGANVALLGAATHLPPPCESPAPVANPDQAQTTPGTPVTVAPLANDVPGDPAAPLRPGTVRLLAPGGAAVSSLVVPGQGTFTVDTVDGEVTFTPAAGFTGTSVAGYRMADAVGTTADSTITVAVGVATTTTTTSTTTSTTLPPTSTTTTSSTTTTVPVGDSCATLTPTILGTGGADTIFGTPGTDVIAAGGGDDTVSGLGGDDVLCGGEGADTLYGGDGDDRIEGSEGDDFLNGQNGKDRSLGGDGSDTIAGGNGDDFVAGGDGNDFLNGRDGDDHVEGNAGADRVLGGAGDDELMGNAGTDVLNALQGDAGGFADTLGGGSELDQCFSDPGDTPVGLTGADC